MTPDIDLHAVSELARNIARTDYPDQYDIKDLAHAFAVFIEYYAALEKP